MSDCDEDDSERRREEERRRIQAPAKSSPEIGIKHDGEKPKLSSYLHPLFANRHFMPIVTAVIGVLQYGAKKYGPDNWTLVTPKERYLDAALRHLSAADSGTFLDDESGLPHVAHAATSILMYGAKTLAERAKTG